MYDGVKIYSLATGGPALATLCGTHIPGPFFTFGPMLLHFYSDSTITSTGYMAEYSAIRKYSRWRMIDKKIINNFKEKHKIKFTDWHWLLVSEIGGPWGIYLFLL